MQRHKRQLARLDAIDDGLAILGSNLSLTDVTPPDQHVTIFQHVRPDTFVGIILLHGAYLYARLGLEVIGNGIAQKIFVCLFLARLLFIPNHHANVCSGSKTAG